MYVASVEKEERILELEADVTSQIQEIEKLKERLSHLEHENSQFRQNTEQLLKDLENVSVVYLLWIRLMLICLIS